MEIVAFFDYKYKKFLITRQMETLIYSIRENGSNRLEISESEEKYLDSMDLDVISHINLKYNLMPETMFVEEGKSNKEKEHSEKSNKNFF